MINKFYRSALILVALGMFVSAPKADARPSQAGHVHEAVMHAQDAVDHGKQGDAKGLVKEAKRSLYHAERGGHNNPQLAAGIIYLKEAIKHGIAGHADIAKEHAEVALTHLTEADENK
jgi:Small metal-binding protein